MQSPTAPIEVDLETERFFLQSMRPEEITERMCAWLADPRKAHMINAPARTMIIADFERYLASHDRKRGHLLGIRSKLTGELIGFWAVYVDWPNGEFLVNVLLGERGAYTLGAREETQMALLTHFFDVLHLQIFRCNALARNRHIGKVLIESGATLEHSSYRASAAGGPMLELQHYRADKAAWHRLRDRVMPPKKEGA